MSIEKYLTPSKRLESSLFNQNSLESKSQRVKPSKPKNVVLYDQNTILSKSGNKSDEFTNFLSRNNINEFSTNIFNYVRKDWEPIYEEELHEVENDERLARIFRLYINNDDCDFKKIMKVKVKKEHLTQSTSLRFFVIVDESVYKLFLIDPLHLVIPSKVQREGDTYLKNKGNGLCMSTVIKNIKNYC